MPKLNANGLNFHYQQAGEGPDIVLIHGVTGDLSIWFLCEAMGVLGQLIPGDRVRPARPRLQRRTPLTDTRRPIRRGDVMAIMDALEIDRAMLLGHSFGAVIATHAAVSCIRTESMPWSSPTHAFPRCATSRT